MMAGQQWTRSRRAGFTMIEMLMSVSLALIIGTAALQIITTQAQQYTVKSLKLDTQYTLRSAASILGFAIMEASASGGDLESISATTIRIRAARASGVICSQYSQWMGLREVSGHFESQDSVFVYSVDKKDWEVREADSTLTTKSAALVQTPNCFWGDTTTAPTPDAALRLNVATAVADSVQVGSVVRAFHWTEYSLQARDGRYWLAQKQQGETAYALIVGPLLSPADSGVSFSFFDDAGATTTTPADVASVGILLRAESMHTSTAIPSSNGRLTDSLRTVVYIRNN